MFNSANAYMIAPLLSLLIAAPATATGVQNTSPTGEQIKVETAISSDDIVEETKAEEPATAVPEGETKVCKSVRLVDSRIPQRICMKQWEWEEKQRAEMENKTQNRNRNSSCGNAIRC